MIVYSKIKSTFGFNLFSFVFRLSRGNELSSQLEQSVIFRLCFEFVKSGKPKSCTDMNGGCASWWNMIEKRERGAGNHYRLARFNTFLLHCLRHCLFPVACSRHFANLQGGNPCHFLRKCLGLGFQNPSFVFSPFPTMSSRIAGRAISHTSI